MELEKKYSDLCEEEGSGVPSVHDQTVENLELEEEVVLSTDKDSRVSKPLPASTSGGRRKVHITPYTGNKPKKVVPKNEKRFPRPPQRERKRVSEGKVFLLHLWRWHHMWQRKELEILGEQARAINANAEV